jgi:exopolyphosphatase/guanosine-5'-triphosphate,3'-diphosphate pyrophosphatase
MNQGPAGAFVADTQDTNPPSTVPETGVADLGLFGKPLFLDPSARALSRVGVVDVGSNSVRLVVFDGAARSPAYFYNEKIMCALGAGMAETGHLSPQGRARALSAMRRFSKLADGMDLAELTVVATAAVRDASDGRAFCDEVERETGLKIWVIDGEEEARLSAQGVLLGWPGAYGLVCDIGGSSMELAEISAGRVGKRVTSALGPLKLRDLKGGAKSRQAHIKDVMQGLAEKMGAQRDRLFLVGGSWRAIARIDMVRQGYPLHVLHEYRMTAKSVRATVKHIKNSDLEELRQISGVSSSRMALVPFAAEVLSRLVKTFKPKDIAISSYGIREGMLYEQMPQRLRDRERCPHPRLWQGVVRLHFTALQVRVAAAQTLGQSRMFASRRQLARASRLPCRGLFRQRDPRQLRRPKTCRAYFSRSCTAPSLFQQTRKYPL